MDNSQSVLKAIREHNYSIGYHVGVISGLDISIVRSELERLENEGCYHKGRLREGNYGTFWHDEVNDIFYEYPSDGPNFRSNKLTNENILEVEVFEPW